MRLWHKDLIPVLPRQQLLGQWRECCLIAKSIAEKGTPNHILVNKVMDYPLEHFFTYSIRIYEEMNKRGYKVDKNKFIKYFPTLAVTIEKKYLFSDWHNDRYFWQCYYNLEEKYDCGGISAEDWEKILLKALKQSIKNGR